MVDEMMFYQIVCFLVLSLVFAIIILACMFRRNQKRFRLSFVLGHFFFLCVAASLVLIYSHDGQAGLLWLVPMLMDFPLSLLLFPLRSYFSILGPSDVLGPFAFFTFVGSVEYYLYGFLLDKLVNIWMRRRSSGSYS